MKQLTDKVFAQVRKALLEATVYIEVEGSIEHSKDHQAAIAALDIAQPEPDVNAMLAEALQAAEKLEHEALVALSEATYELKVGNTYTTATDTYKANNDLIHRLDKILNSQYRDRKRAAPTAAKQAQPVCGYDDKTGNCTRVNCCKQAQPDLIPQESLFVCGQMGANVTKVYAEQAQPERAPLSDAEIEYLRGEANRGYCIDKVDYFKAFRDAEQAHGIKQGGQHE